MIVNYNMVMHLNKLRKQTNQTNHIIADRQDILCKDCLLQSQTLNIADLFPVS
jgi:hypothetical protein